MTLLRAIELHMAKTGESASQFGRNAVQDPRLVPDLRKGRELRSATEARVRAYLEAAQ